MSERFRPDPDEFDRARHLLCTKIEAVAKRSGMPEMDCEDLERSLAAMGPTVRQRVKLMLDGIAIQTEYDDRTMAFTARYLLKLAHGFWEENPHPVRRQ